MLSAFFWRIVKVIVSVRPKVIYILDKSVKVIFSLCVGLYFHLVHKLDERHGFEFGSSNKVLRCKFTAFGTIKYGLLV